MNCESYLVIQMLHMGKKCPRYDELLKLTLEAHDVKEEEKENKVRFVKRKKSIIRFSCLKKPAALP